MSNMNKDPLYIANGKWFISYEAVVEYAKDLGLRVVSTETIKQRRKFGHRIIVTLGQ